jgi:CheY-like chemotaxis protein
MKPKPQATIARLEDTLKQISHLGHDLRAPLSNILGYTRLLMRAQQPPRNAIDIERLAIIERSGEQLLGVVDAVLSLSRAGPLTESAPVDTLASVQGRQRTVLVVDDDAATRRLLEVMCRHWGFQVQHADSGANALAACREPQAAVDVVLVDQRMPGMSGWEFVQALRLDARWCGLPVVMISGDPERPADLPSDIDVQAVLMKPFDQASLATALQHVLGL